MKDITNIAAADCNLARDDHRVTHHDDPAAVWSLAANGVKLGWKGIHLHEARKALSAECDLAGVPVDGADVTVMCRGLPTAIGWAPITHAEAVAAMDASGLTRADIARATGVSTTAVNKWDRGHNTMTWTKWAYLNSLRAK